MQVSLDIPIRKIVDIINNMSKAEIETLLFEINTTQCDELKIRMVNLKKEIKESKILSTDELF